MNRLIALALVSFAAAVAIQLLPGGGGTSESATVNVAVEDNAFAPQHITITVGDTVNWDWAGSFNAHNVIADDASFISGTYGAPFMYQVTFASAGTFGYHCSVHGAPGVGQFGTITVQEPAATSTPAVAATDTAVVATPTSGTSATNTPAAGATGTPAVSASSTPATGGTAAAGAATPGAAVTLPSTGRPGAGEIGWLTWGSITLASLGALALVSAAAQRRRG